MIKKMYIVKYYGGNYDDFYKKDIFVTSNKKIATKYVTRFNKILKKWKDYYSTFCDNKYGFESITDKDIDKFDRWNSLSNITKCYWECVEVR